MKQIFFLSLFLFLFACKNKTAVTDTASSTPTTTPKVEVKKTKVSTPIISTFDRTSIIDRLHTKIKDNKPLVVHAMVPLCDNDNQGIVKVNKNLGNGLSLRTNLYWGSKYGVKNFFHKLSPWQLLESKKDITPNILERIIFYREFSNGAKVYLVADAYRGDRMKECLHDYLHALSGTSKESVAIKDQTISIKSGADLLIFNGHNGLMDYDMNFVKNTDGRIREASVIGCISHDYFVDHCKQSKAYPLLMTTGLMAPEAYVMEGLINEWAMVKEEKEIKAACAKAYHKYQKCGLRGASRLFRSGW